MGPRTLYHSLFNKSNKNATAIIYNNQEKDMLRITYSTLFEECDTIGWYMKNRLGISKNNIVCIVYDCYPIAEIVSVLTCIHQDCIFVPIDIRWRPTKIQTVIEEVHPVACLVVANTEFDEAVVAVRSYGIHRCVFLTPMGKLHPSLLCSINDMSGCSSDASVLADAANASMIENPNTTASPSYILYTSGTTGKPSGVVGSEEGLLCRIQWQQEFFPWVGEQLCSNLGSNSKVRDIQCRRTPLCFIDSLNEILNPLIHSVPIYVPSYNSLLGVLDLVKGAIRAEATRITLLPYQLEMILKHIPNIGELWHSLRYLTVSGDKVTPHLIHRFLECFSGRDCPSVDTSADTGLHCRVMLINLYGSTEVSGDMCGAILHNPTKLQSPSLLKSYVGMNMPIGCLIGDTKCDYHRVKSAVDSSSRDFHATDDIYEWSVGGSCLCVGYCGENVNCCAASTIQCGYQNHKHRMGDLIRPFRVAIPNVSDGQSVEGYVDKAKAMAFLARTGGIGVYMYYYSYFCCTDAVCQVPPPPNSWSDRVDDRIQDGLCGKCYQKWCELNSNISETDSSGFCDDGVTRAYLSISSCGNFLVLWGIWVYVGRVGDWTKINGVRLNTQQIEADIQNLLLGIGASAKSGSDAGMLSVERNKIIRTQNVNGEVMVCSIMNTEEQEQLVCLVESKLVCNNVLGGSCKAIQMNGVVESSSIPFFRSVSTSDSNMDATSLAYTLSDPTFLNDWSCNSTLLRDLLLTEQLKGSLSHVPRMIVVIDRLPITLAGKVDRVGCKRLLQNMWNEWQAVAGKNGNQLSLDTNPGTFSGIQGRNAEIKLTLDVLMECCSSILSAPLQVQTFRVSTFYGLGGDSMKLVEFLWKLHHFKDELLHSAPFRCFSETMTRNDASWEERKFINKFSAALCLVSVQSVTRCSMDELVCTIVDNLNASFNGVDTPAGSATPPNNVAMVPHASRKRKLSPEKSPCIANMQALQCRRLQNAFRKMKLATSVSVTRRHGGGYVATNCVPHADHETPSCPFGSDTTKFVHEFSINIDDCFQLKRCVDNSPLCVCYHSKTNPNCGPDHSTVVLAGTESAANTAKEEDADRDVKVVYCGSHAGDVTALLLAQDGSFHSVSLWCTSLYEHIEGGMATNRDGSLLYVTSYVGQDIDKGIHSDEVPPDFDRCFRNSLGSLWCLATCLHSHGLNSACNSPIDRDDPCSYYSPSNNNIVWRCELKGEVKGSPVHDAHSDVIYVACHDGVLYGLNALSGAVLLRLNIGGSLFATPLVIPIPEPRSHDSACSDTQFYSKLFNICCVSITGNVQLHRISIVNRAMNGNEVLNSIPFFYEDEEDESEIEDENAGKNCKGIHASEMLSRVSLLNNVLSHAVNARSLNVDEACGSKMLFTTCVQIESKRLWRIAMDGIFASPTMCEAVINPYSNCNSVLNGNDGDEANPRFACSQLLLLGTVTHLIHGISMADGKVLWTCSDCQGSIFCSITPVPSSYYNTNWDVNSHEARENKYPSYVGIVGCNDGYVRAIDCTTGVLVWKTNVHCAIYATPVCRDDNVIVATTGGNVFVLDCHTGSICTSIRLPAEIFSSPITQIVQRSVQKNNHGYCSKGMIMNIYLGCRDDRIYALKYIHNSEC